MAIHVLERRSFISRPPSEVFPFFADASNLERLTPPWLQFRIVTPRPIEMAAGTEIDYRLRVHGIPLRWRSRITVWDPPHAFMDIQLRGPYRIWEHEHRFEPEGDGTTVIDRVRYATPGGELVHRLFVRRDVEKIFDYRERQLEEIFSGSEDS